jgi:TRAP-type C4-dicarboxylate transport system permease small subunit
VALRARLAPQPALCKEFEIIMVRLLSFISSVVACLAIGAMVLVTLIDVLGRNFYVPLAGASELTRFLLAFGFVAGIALINRSDGHITVGLLHDFYPARFRRLDIIVSRFGTALGSGFLVWMLFDQGMRLNRSGALTDYFSWPYAPFVFLLAALAVCATGLAIATLLSPLPAQTGETAP